MADSFFVTDDGDWFVPTDACRGPWHPDHCHAGPPAGLLARALERALSRERAPDRAVDGDEDGADDEAEDADEAMLVRLTVDLGRPIPMAGFRVRASVTRLGRTVAATAATLLDGDDRPCATAAGLHLVPRPPVELPTAAVNPISPDDAEPGPFPIRRSTHDRPGFNTAGAEMRYPPGQTPDPGPTTVWTRTLPLLADEAPSPAQRCCPLADCGNAFSRNAELEEVAFVNPDVTLVVHRAPVGEWLGSSSISHWQPNGIGVADALLFDRLGPVGRAMQTLVLRPAA